VGCFLGKFDVLITEDPFGSKDLVEKFAKVLAGWEPVGVHLRDASCLLNFLWEGGGELRVRLFNDTSCGRHYHSDINDDIGDE
jgi:hypothetical protein